MIKIDNLTKKFSSHVSLDRVTCEFNKNDSIALMGPNGAGKTTLIRSILGYYHPDDGEVLVNGLSPIHDRVNVLKNISFVPQLPPPIKLSIDELMSYVQTSSDVSKELILHYANEMKLDVKSNINKSFFKLSGGMKQKLLIAISLAKKSKIIIYDEPTANLDPVPALNPFEGFLLLPVYIYLVVDHLQTLTMNSHAALNVVVTPVDWSGFNIIFFCKLLANIIFIYPHGTSTVVTCLVCLHQGIRLVANQVEIVKITPGI